jgi:hypothetical protein
MASKKITLEDLAGMVQRGFSASDERFDGLEQRFDGLEQKLDTHMKDSRREHAQIYARLTDTVSRAESVALLDRVDRLESQRA